ncbi:hypothetical protein ACLOJK_027578 [Asimina triloba]
MVIVSGETRDERLSGCSRYLEKKFKLPSRPKIVTVIAPQIQKPRGVIIRAGKGKAPNASRETSTTRPHVRRAPTNDNKLDQVIERVVESRMAQETIRLKLVSKLEMLQRFMANIAAYIIKINEKQALRDAKMTFLRWRLKALQIQLKETSLGKRKAETSPNVLEQLRREAKIRQPVPRRRVKMAVSKKRPTYPDPKDEESVEEIPPQQEGLKEPPVGPESNSGTNFTIPNPPSLILEKMFHHATVRTGVYEGSTPEATEVS